MCQHSFQTLSVRVHFGLSRRVRACSLFGRIVQWVCSWGGCRVPGAGALSTNGPPLLDLDHFIRIRSPSFARIHIVWPYKHNMHIKRSAARWKFMIIFRRFVFIWFLHHRHHHRSVVVRDRVVVVVVVAIFNSFPANSRIISLLHLSPIRVCACARVHVCLCWVFLVLFPVMSLSLTNIRLDFLLCSLRSRTKIIILVLYCAFDIYNTLSPFRFRIISPILVFAHFVFFITWPVSFIIECAVFRYYHDTLAASCLCFACGGFAFVCPVWLLRPIKPNSI